jgi:cell division inhibitor SepF
VNNILKKLQDFVGLNDSGYEDVDYTGDITNGDYSQALYREESSQLQDEEPVTNRPTSRRGFMTDPELGTGVSMSNVIGMPRPTNGVPEVVIMEPRSFEEMPQAIQALRERKSVILNLGMMDLEQAQRAVDFVAGGTYAIDGHQERIGESIFLFTPNCVQVSTKSGVTHEVPQPQVRPNRPPAPSPAWVSEETTMTATA